MTGLASTVYGVDFGAGERNAGRKTWIARGAVDDGGVRVTHCETVESAFDGDPKRRNEALAALVGFLSGEGAWETGDGDKYRVEDDTAVGLDFPFGLPAAVLGDEFENWRAFVEVFPDGLPPADDWDGNVVDDPRSLSAWGSHRARENDETDCVHCKRETDATVGAQPPYGIVGKYITYHGIVSVLSEVRDAVTVAPMETDGHTAPEDGPFVLEAYPAGTLGRLGLYRTGYKGTGETEGRRRERNLCGLEQSVDALEIERSVVETATGNPGGDALDAVVAAVATYEATRSADTLAPDEAHYDDREGYIYV
ncbi:DUF429 domain-containing protein [Haloarchaeobius iranensis]|uniref:DUF429 domain-containing protein n=1 Tax=Haloarchaeobius iranensis TaxID=996166 RepID=A0A1G9TAK3_9EURY|nr:DUF429 domain-containing protein [Haloarchaeobius iranensis]SDM44743.1 Protein of unknown function [Haloarchaeobius iranensis]